MITTPNWPVGWRVKDGNDWKTIEPGWTVSGPDGEVIAQSESATAAEMNAISGDERSVDNGSDRSGSVQSDS